mmetsp:Transcript_91252/g.144161  ORF Transcript_91252/g.144161 Transcript_91252/m.144161 type:complete len:248 (+) Transcript_91252:1856-2599(+)
MSIRIVLRKLLMSLHFIDLITIIAIASILLLLSIVLLILVLLILIVKMISVLLHIWIALVDIVCSIALIDIGLVHFTAIVDLVHVPTLHYIGIWIVSQVASPSYILWNGDIIYFPRRNEASVFEDIVCGSCSALYHCLRDCRSCQTSCAKLSDGLRQTDRLRHYCRQHGGKIRNSCLQYWHLRLRCSCSGNAWSRFNLTSCTAECYWWHRWVCWYEHFLNRRLGDKRTSNLLPFFWCSCDLCRSHCA